MTLARLDSDTLSSLVPTINKGIDVLGGRSSEGVGVTLRVNNIRHAQLEYLIWTPIHLLFKAIVTFSRAIKFTSCIWSAD